MAPSRSTARNQLVAITGCTPATATSLLEKHNWKLEEAVNAYLENGLSRTTPVASDPQIEHIYNTYQDQGDPERIDVDGVLRYLEDLGIEPEDPKSLTLAFFLEAPSMGVFTRAKFIGNWSRTTARSVAEMKQYIESLHSTIQDDPLQFVQLYNFTFDFSMENPGQRLLAIDTAVEYWKMLLYQRREFEGCQARFDQWFLFLTTHKKAITKDTWRMVYLFFKEVVAADPSGLLGYDEMASWPSVIDEYIEWLRDSGEGP
jgi:DCN1-like protein 1/2